MHATHSELRHSDFGTSPTPPIRGNYVAKNRVSRQNSWRQNPAARAGGYLPTAPMIIFAETQEKRPKGVTHLMIIYGDMII
jgi:hypothetical protein